MLLRSIAGAEFIRRLDAADGHRQFGDALRRVALCGGGCFSGHFRAGEGNRVRRGGRSRCMTHATAIWPGSRCRTRIVGIRELAQDHPSRISTVSGFAARTWRRLLTLGKCCGDYDLGHSSQRSTGVQCEQMDQRSCRRPGWQACQRHLVEQGQAWFHIESRRAPQKQ